METEAVGRWSAREGAAIVSRAEAEELASRWLGVPGESVELREFDEGWVAWPMATGTAPGVLPDRVGDARVVVDRASGRVSSWPPLPVEEIIARNRSAAVGRFPADVEALLRKAGWYPGRVLPDEDIDRYAERLSALTADEETQLTIIDAARHFLTEFGGLTIGAAPRKATAFQPRPSDPDIDSFVFLADVISQSITPIGTIDDEDYPEEVVLADDGRVFVSNFSGVYLLADNADWAVVRLTTGRRSPLPLVGEDGEVQYIDGLGDPIDPGSTRGPSGAEGANVAEEPQDAADQGDNG